MFLASGIDKFQLIFSITQLLRAPIALLTQMGKQASAGVFATLHCDVFTSTHPKDRLCLILLRIPSADIELMHKLNE